MTKAPAAQWQWQRGGWLLVDRTNGHATRVSLPDYDFYYSAIVWYRDYAAYCGLAKDGKKVLAIVAQLGRRQPVLKKALGEPAGEDVPDSACSAPVWQRQPACDLCASAGAKVYLRDSRACGDRGGERGFQLDFACAEIQLPLSMTKTKSCGRKSSQQAL